MSNKTEETKPWKVLLNSEVEACIKETLKGICQKSAKESAGVVIGEDPGRVPGEVPPGRRVT